MTLPDAALILLNYNGKALLEKYLGSFIKAAQQSQAKCRVIILDNESHDGSVEFVREKYPEVTLFQASSNKVLCSFNEIIPQISEEVVILLNNDIQAEPDFVDPLLKLFREKTDIFFAATHGDRSIPKFRWGALSADTDHLDENPSLLETQGYSFSAGIAAFDRRKFQEIGGYDEMYLPGYYEDVDLCFRGWKHGWKGYYEPNSKKTHEGSTSFKSKYGSFFIQKIAFRNSLLFMIKNIHDRKILTRWIFMFTLRLLSAWLAGHFFVYPGFVEALSRIRVALKARCNVKSFFTLSDQQVFNYFGAQ